MLHRKRVWNVSPVATAEELAEKLANHTWTLCTAFELAGYHFLNDATSEDGAQEYAVLKRLPNGTWLQIESITFGWSTSEKALALVKQVLNGDYDQADYATAVQPKLQTPAGHSRCHLCQ